MHLILSVAPETMAMHYNGQGNPVAQAHDASDMGLRNRLPTSMPPQAEVQPHARQPMIQTATYFLAQDRELLARHDMDGWMAAAVMGGHVLAAPPSSC